MKEYFQHLDLLKGLAILLMVMGHSIAWSFPDWSFLTGTWSDMPRNEFYASFMWKIIYSFHMPLLFFVSGFLFYKSNPLTMRTVRDICFKRVQRLLIPYLTTGVFVYLLKGYFGYWFFIVLFILNIIVLFELYFEQKLRIEGKSEFVSHIIMFIGLCVSSRYYTDYLPTELSNLSGIGQYYLVFIFGYLIHKHSKFETLILSNWSMAISFISYILLVTVIIYYGQLKPLKMMIPLLAITFLYALMKKIASEDKLSALGGVLLCGKYSMEIYVFHLFFVIQLPMFGNYLLTIDNFSTSISLQLTYSMLISVIAIFFSIIIAGVIKNNYYVSKFLFGN